MATNNIQYATVFTKALRKADELRPRYTADLDSKAARFEDLGGSGKVIKYFITSTDGLVDYDRSNHTMDTTEVNHEEGGVLELKYDRGYKHKIDPNDFNDTNYTLTLADLANETKYHTDTEVDIVRLSTLASEAGEVKEEKLTEENAYEEVRDSILKAKDLSNGEVIAYVSSEVYSFISDSKRFVANRAVRDSGPAGYDLDLEFGFINGTKVVRVPDHLMYTEPDTEGQGIKPSDTSKKIDYVVVPYKAVVAPVKYHKTKFIPADKDQDGFAHILMGRIIHDAHVINGRSRKEATTSNLSDLPAAKSTRAVKTETKK